MITTDRDQFTGIHLRKITKDALRAEAHSQRNKATGRRKTMSQLASEILEEELIRRGWSDIRLQD